ncbi:MAG: TRAP transporter small permease [Limnochordia bacterium]
MNEVEKKLGTIISLLGKAELIAAGALLVATLGLVVLTIVFRYFLHRPIMWASPLVTLCFTWMSLIGIAYVYKAGGHISVTYFKDRLRPVPKAVVEVLILVVVLLCLVIALWSALQILPVHSKRFIVGLRLPRSYLSTAVVLWGISMVLTTVYFLVGSIGRLTAARKGE